MSTPKSRYGLSPFESVAARPRAPSAADWFGIGIGPSAKTAVVDATSFISSLLRMSTLETTSERCLKKLEASLGLPCLIDAEQSCGKVVVPRAANTGFTAMMGAIAEEQALTAASDRLAANATDDMIARISGVCTRALPAHIGHMDLGVAHRLRITDLEPWLPNIEQYEPPLGGFNTNRFPSRQPTERGSAQTCTEAESQSDEPQRITHVRLECRLCGNEIAEHSHDVIERVLTVSLVPLCFTCEDRARDEPGYFDRVIRELYSPRLRVLKPSGVSDDIPRGRLWLIRNPDE